MGGGGWGSGEVVRRRGGSGGGGGVVRGGGGAIPNRYTCSLDLFSARLPPKRYPDGDRNPRRLGMREAIST